MKRLLAVVDMALRKSPDEGNPLFDEFYEWPAGTVFEPPPHLRIDLALQRRIAVWEGDDAALADARAFVEAMRREAQRRTALNEVDEASAVQAEQARLAAAQEAADREKADARRTAAYMKAYDRARAEEARAAESEGED